MKLQGLANRAKLNQAENQPAIEQLCLPPKKTQPTQVTAVTQFMINFMCGTKLDRLIEIHLQLP